MQRAFSRALGSQPGIELAAIEDRTGQGLLGTWDQSVAIVGHFSRGPIHRAFVIRAGNFDTGLGPPQSITQSALNEAHSHVAEALRTGARYAVVSRLAVPGAALSWATFNAGAPSTFAVVATPPASGEEFAVKHLGCHNDGIKVAVHADPKKDAGGALVANDVVTVRIMDAQDKTLFKIRGSLTAGAQDEFNESIYLPDVSEAIAGDMLEWVIPANATIPTTADCYGRDASGREKWVVSGVLATFSPGGSSYSPTDIAAAVLRIKNAPEDYGYLLGGGSRSTTLLNAMSMLAYDTNRQFLFDVPGEYTVAQAAAFMTSVGIGGLGYDHYPQAYFAPFKSLDPLNNVVCVWGTSAAQAGYRCARNRQTNAFGLSAKHNAIAGARGNLGRRSYRPLPTMALTEQDLSDLADARINPVLFQQYPSGSFYTFTDALTSADTKLSSRKLATVAEMSSFIDEMVVRFGREVLMRDMQGGIRAMKDFLQTFFSNCLASEWLVDISDPDLPPFTYIVQPDPDSPKDSVRVTYELHFNGLIRQMRVKQFMV